MTNNDIQQISRLLDNKITPIQNKLSEHDKVLEQHGKVLGEHTKMLTQHGKILRSLKKDQGMMLKMLDGEQMKQRRRITKVENHLGLAPSV